MMKNQIGPGIAVTTCVITIMLLPALLSANDEPQPLQVPVKVAVAASSPEPAMMRADMQADDEPGPTTPGGRLPQYQLHHHNRVEAIDINDARLRLLLALPDQLLLVEAFVTVDAKPFRQARERRIQDVIRFSKDPTAWKAAQQKKIDQQTRDAKTAAAVEAAAVIDNAASVVEGVKQVVQEVLDDSAETGAKDESANPDAAKETSAQTSEDEDPAGENDAENEKNVSEDSADDDPADENEVGQEPDVPALPEYVAPNSVYERIERYVNATGQTPSEEEVRWLFTNWVDGPVLLFLNDNFQRFRADQRPVFKVLDRDRDGIVSAKELDMAVTSFRECDLNRDDVVQHLELSEVAMDPRDRPVHAGAGKLIYTIPTESSSTAVCRMLTQHYAVEESDEFVLDAPDPAPVNAENPVKRFDRNQDGTFDAGELTVLQSGKPDVRLEIAFDSADSSKSTLKIISTGNSFADASKKAAIYPNSVVISFGKTSVEFSAVQQGGDQISVGAVNDGYPMLPLIDPNDDGRFTIRELRSLHDSLKDFDTNQDGTITQDETYSTVRLCFGLGPIVHSELAGLRSIQEPKSETVVQGPAWFTQMDINKDNDLTRKEFPGNDAQFRELDSDDDKLISAAEANEAAKKKENES